MSGLTRRESLMALGAARVPVPAQVRNTAPSAVNEAAPDGGREVARAGDAGARHGGASLREEASDSLKPPRFLGIWNTRYG
jgi:hypothetical protein